MVGKQFHHTTSRGYWCCVLLTFTKWRTAQKTVCKHAMQHIEIITAHIHSVTLETILIAGRKCVDIQMHFRCM